MENEENSKIISVYKLIVYSDGKVETKSMPMDFAFDNVTTVKVTTETSSKTVQILNVLKEIGELISKNKEEDEGDSVVTIKTSQCFDSIVTTAIKNVASKLNVTATTIYDKVGRKLSITKSQFVKKVKDYFENYYKTSNYRNSDLYKLLIANIINNKEVSVAKFDKMLIDRTFKKYL